MGWFILLKAGNDVENKLKPRKYVNQKANNKKSPKKRGLKEMINIRIIWLYLINTWDGKHRYHRMLLLVN